MCVLFVCVYVSVSEVVVGVQMLWKKYVGLFFWIFCADILSKLSACVWYACLEMLTVTFAIQPFINARTSYGPYVSSSHLSCVIGMETIRTSVIIEHCMYCNVTFLS